MLYALITKNYGEQELSLWSNEDRAKFQQRVSEDSWNYDTELFEVEDIIFGATQEDDTELLVGLLTRLMEDEDNPAKYLDDLDLDEFINGDSEIEELVKQILGE